MKVWMLLKVVKLNNLKHSYGTLLKKVQISQKCSVTALFNNFLNRNISCETHWQMVFLHQPHSTMQLVLTFSALLATCSTNRIFHSTNNYTKVVSNLLIPLLCNFSILLLFMSEYYSQHPVLKCPQSSKPKCT
jgi:hypothetical protein